MKERKKTKKEKKQKRERGVSGETLHGNDNQKEAMEDDLNETSGVEVVEPISLDKGSKDVKGNEEKKRKKKSKKRKSTDPLSTSTSNLEQGRGGVDNSKPVLAGQPKPLNLDNTGNNNLSENSNHGDRHGKKHKTKDSYRKPEEPKETEKREEDAESDSDDDVLMAAAAAWADQQTDNPNEDSKVEQGGEQKGDDDSNTRKARLISKEKASSVPQSLSLHITQLPYDTNELDIRKLFAENGCMASSIRLVYDRDASGRKTVFRGVAFVDLLDTPSYEKGLKMNHKCSIRGRKLNIRPTRSKQELADIVSKTKELVQEKIRNQLVKENSGDDGGVEDDDEKKKVASSKKQRKKEKKRLKRAKAKAKNNKHKKPTAGEETAAKAKDPNWKLTKKDRNRRAAIIMMQKKRRI